jgi:hypothetical protein
MNHKRIANGIGWLGVACSLAFWVWVPIYAVLPFHQRGDWMKLGLGESNIWPALWLTGFLLSFVAAIVGSRKWAFAAFVPVISCAAAIAFLSMV